MSAACVTVALVAAALGACGGGTTVARVYPGELAHPGTLGPDVAMRQHIVARWPDAAPVELDAVVEKRDGVLRVLVLTPWGGRGVLVEHAGSDVRVERWVDQEIPFPPRYILLDVQRAFFAWIGAAVATAPDGSRAAVVRGEEVVESWRDGRLYERTFERADRRPPGRVRVELVGGAVPDTAPPRVRLHNEWIGYTLDIETIEWRALPATTPSPPAPAAPRSPTEAADR